MLAIALSSAVPHLNVVLQIANISTLASIYHKPPEFFVKDGKTVVLKPTKSDGKVNPSFVCFDVCSIDDTMAFFPYANKTACDERFWH